MDYMNEALKEAKKAYIQGEVPIGAVIVKDDIIIARAFNMKETLNLATAHAEILAINKASEFLKSWRLNGCEMYVTVEPCAMCASAIAHARISRLHIGTFNRDMGACGTIFNILDYDIFNTTVDIKWCYNDKCSNIITQFFEERRKEKILNKKIGEV